MRQTEIFSGRSHPDLVKGICDRLSQTPGKAELKEFSNGETGVQLQTSVRDKDVFIVQSGSNDMNNKLMELLIMIAACKGGSAKTITAVMPYFPYCRQSKKKSHRGAIVARMVANLLSVAGVTHVITIDLHASQMQGFFTCTMDNLVAEPLIARWIKANIPDWHEAVVVSKNACGTKRVTSLADALKLSFGIVTTDRRRLQTQGSNDPYSMVGSSMMLEKFVEGLYERRDDAGIGIQNEIKNEVAVEAIETPDYFESDGTTPNGMITPSPENPYPDRRGSRTISQPTPLKAQNGIDMSSLLREAQGLIRSSEDLLRSRQDDSEDLETNDLRRSRTEPATIAELEEDFTDERARDVTTARLVHGHIVDDEDQDSPFFSATSVSATPHLSRIAPFEGTNDTPQGNSEAGDTPEHMVSSFISNTSSFKEQSAVGGTLDQGAISEEEEEELQNPAVEATVTLVGNVRDRPVFLIDDMIDKSASWIAAAETVVKRGGATKVYCFATHGIFGDECLLEMENCECIEKIVVTNSFPITDEKVQGSRKLVILDVSSLLAEAIRRNKHGESISQLFMHYD